MIKNGIALVFFVCSCFLAKAQNWGGGIDDGDYNWGFTFQYISSDYKIIKKYDWRKPFPDPSNPTTNITDTLSSISSPNTMGFGVGFVINKRLTSNMDLRFTPGLAFSDRMITYQYKEQVNNTSFSSKLQKTTPVMVEFPVGIKIKSDRRRDFRAYLLLGGKYGIDMGGKKKEQSENDLLNVSLRNRKTILTYEGGIGFDFYFEYFKMSPEIKLSYSARDVIDRKDQDKNPYSTPIDRAILRNFTFSLFFE
jgi:hypothetical protein